MRPSGASTASAPRTSRRHVQPACLDGAARALASEQDSVAGGIRDAEPRTLGLRVRASVPQAPLDLRQIRGAREDDLEPAQAAGAGARGRRPLARPRVRTDVMVIAP